MFNIKPAQHYQQQQLGQALSPTIVGNSVPFVLGMVTWAVFGGVFKSLFGIGEAAVSRGATAARTHISGGKKRA